MQEAADDDADELGTRRYATFMVRMKAVESWNVCAIICIFSVSVVTVRLAVTEADGAIQAILARSPARTASSLRGVA